MLQALASGLAASEIVRTMGVSRSSLVRWRRKERLGQSLEPGHAPGRRRLIDADAEGQLRAQVMTFPDATVAEHAARWAESGHGVQVRAAMMCRSLQRLGMTLKKRP